jgi:demethylmenaquinone methyltransferase/2-methoxy-6-polyprenyl-1,4-benzoquinol methylase
MAVDKSGERVRQMFGEIAPRYDALNHLLSLNIDRYWRWYATRKVQPPAKLPILDVCTGTGDLALAWQHKVPIVPVLAADFCHSMLVLGDQKRQRSEQGKQGQRVLFLEADTQQLPFADNQFGVVSVAFGLRNVSDTMQGLREMTRVCAPSGQVAILEFSMPQWQPFKAVYGCYFRYILPRVGQLLARNRQSAYNYLPSSVAEFPQDETLAGMMREAGLREVRYHSLTLGVATLYVGTK